MFILTYQSYSEIPQKRSDFYKQVFDTLYSVHDSVSKLSFVREKQSGLSKERFEDLLKLFSFISYFEEKFLYQPEYLESKFTFIKEKKKSLSFDNQKVIEDLQVAIGILNKEGVEYTFPHRSLQEFFAANYISSLSDANKQAIYSKIKSTINKRWLYLIDNHHFLSLLAEQDYKSIITLLAIPLLTHEFDRAKKVSAEEYGEMYDIVCKVFLTAAHLLQQELREETIHNDFCKEHRPRIIIMGGSKEYFTMPQLKKEKITEADIKKSLELINKNSDKWLADINKNIEDQEKSDSDIIDLI